MKNIILTALLLTPFISIGQITVDSTVDEIQAMETLLGENVTVSNITWSGAASQIGIFGCMDCGLDFEGGVIISSGDVNEAEGPNDLTAAGANLNVGPVNEEDMTLAEPDNPEFYDLAILEFDFVALGDSVWFDYIWASEEYPNFIGGGINDQFAFFMSGPGINGAYSNNAENLAVIPGTTDAVTNENINNGNEGTNGPCMNCEYYVHNGTGVAGEPQFTDNTVIQYDGYTSGLRAVQGGLQCGETYHLKICIADVGDGIYDSAVILKAGSLTSNLTVQVDLEIEATNNDGVMNEECGLSTLTFSRPESIASELPFTVNIAYSGDAENGVDYTLLPEQLVFDPGVNVIEFTLDAFEDGVIEGLESVILDMQSVAVCEGESVPSTFEFFITESAPLEVEGYEVDICEGGSVEIEPIIINGSGGFEYSWSTLETTPEITVSPAVTSTYSVTISDTCLVSSEAANIEVNVAQFPPLEIFATPDNVNVDCNWFGEFVNLSASGGDDNYSFTYSLNGGETYSFGNSFYLFDANSEVIGYVSDGCGTQAEIEIDINLNIPELNVQYPDTVFTCPGDYSIEPIVTGGTQPYNFFWSDEDFNFITDPIYNGNAAEETFVNFSVSDGCGLGVNETIVIFIQTPEDLLISAGADEMVSCETTVNLSGEVLSGVQPFSYTWQTIDNTNLGTNISEPVVIVEDQTFIFSVDDNCGQSMSDTVIVTLNDTPLEITLPVILAGDCQTVFQVQAETNLIGSNLILSWTGGSGMNVIAPDAVSYQSFESGTIEVLGDAGCGNTAVASTEIVVASPPISLSVSQDTTICNNGLAVLSANVSGGTGLLNLNWLGEDSSDSFLTVTPSLDTTYGLVVTDECLNQNTDSVTVYVNDIDVSFTTFSDEPYTYLFTPEVEPECLGCSYFWSFSDGNTSDEETPYHAFGQTGYVGAFLEVTSEIGCVAQFSEYLSVPPIIYVPNSFTPDNDGINDAFYVIADGIDEYELSIFNRWGEIVFQSKDPTEAWVGNTIKGGNHYVPAGVYSYALKYRGLDSDSQTKTGTVTVVR